MTTFYKYTDEFSNKEKDYNTIKRRLIPIHDDILDDLRLDKKYFYDKWTIQKSINNKHKGQWGWQLMK